MGEDLYSHANGLRRPQAFDFFSPFDERHSIAIEIFLNADGDGLGDGLRGRIKPIKINVIEWQFVLSARRREMLRNERERRAGDRLDDTESRSDALRETGLARAQISRKRDDIAGMELRGEFAAKRLRFRSAVRDYFRDFFAIDHAVFG